MMHWPIRGDRRDSFTTDRRVPFALRAAGAARIIGMTRQCVPMLLATTTTAVAVCPACETDPTDRRLRTHRIGACRAFIQHGNGSIISNGAYMDTRWICPTPGCQTVLRNHIGLHGPSDPPVWNDSQGEHVRCPKCHARIRGRLCRIQIPCRTYRPPRSSKERRHGGRIAFAPPSEPAPLHPRPHT